MGTINKNYIFSQGAIIRPIVLRHKWKFDALETSIFANENIRFKNIKFPPGNYQAIVHYRVT